MIDRRFASVAFAFLFLGSIQLGAVEKRLPMKGEVFAMEDRPAFLIFPEKHGRWRAWPATMGSSPRGTLIKWSASARSERPALPSHINGSMKAILT